MSKHWKATANTIDNATMPTMTGIPGFKFEISYVSICPETEVEFFNKLGVELI